MEILSYCKKVQKLNFLRPSNYLDDVKYLENPRTITKDLSEIFNKQLPITVKREEMKKKKVSNKKKANEQEDLFDYSQLED